MSKTISASIFHRLYRPNANSRKRENGCLLIIAGSEGNIISSKMGNAGMAKGGSGDVLAGLTAAFFCKNSPKLSASAAVFAVDSAGDELFKTRKYFYDSEDLGEQLPLTLAKLFKN